MGRVVLSIINYLGVSSMPLRVLRKKYAGHGSAFLHLNGVDLHYRVEGRGPTLVLVHGFGASLHTWDGWVRELRDSYRVVRIDLPTFGLSSHAVGSKLSIDVFVDFLEEVAARLELGRFSLAGSSMGGHIAWRFAARDPRVVEKLILISSGGYPMQMPWAVRALDLPLVGALFPRLAPRFLVEMNLREAYGDRSKLDAGTVRRYHDLMLRPGGRRALWCVARGVRRCDPMGIRQVQAPTLVLWGAEDRLVPPSHAERFVRDLPCARLVKYAGVGHAVMEEIPEQSARDARAFLSAAGL